MTMIEELVAKAKADGASDIHLVAGLPPKYRLSGDVVNMSETGLSRLFRSITGLSCIDYVIEYRLTKARGLLRTTDKPIIEIAFDTGFNNISYFNRTFKKHFHQTPTEFRKNN